ncbi:uncharacterized protein LOC133143964 isoform X2 [Syngnathus typhle]|uniref:uncharacterized protein LOC133143964 isoform X2 n=1 Tax=Syngnathus typhle TaxID=161592 RepID=UPI002A69B28D|nr:uncharacterized protein LOC133143964 isoform X2 [Syngnathus typhle]
MQQRKMLECANQDSRKKCSQGERETRRKYNLRSGQGQMTQAEVQKNELMCPLVTTSGGQHYEPMVLRDVTAMMEKMPPLHRGGKVWLNKFLALMSGQSCTLGDMRQMLAGACSLVQLQAIEEAAGTARLGREVPLPQVAAPLFENIKLTFPQPTDLAPTMFPYDVKMSPAQHYVTCVESWIETTGRHPALTHEAEVLFRTALLDGLPPDVKKQLMSDPDILAPQVVGRGRGQFRGGYRGRGGSAPAYPGRATYKPHSTNACFICGETDHWARGCPQYRPRGATHPAEGPPYQPGAPMQQAGTAPPGGRPWQQPQTHGGQYYQHDDLWCGQFE